MITGAWVCLLTPLAGFLAILLAGTRITRRQAGIVSTGSVFVGFAGALVAEMTLGSRVGDATRVAKGALIGRAIATALKVAIGIALLAWVVIVLLIGR